MSVVNTAFIDSQVLLSEGLSTLFEKNKYPRIKVMQKCTNIVDFLGKDLKGIDIIFMDIDLNGDDAIPYIPELKSKYADAKVVIFTNHGDPKFVKEAMKRGADGYILKTVDYLEVIECIEEVLKGNIYVGEGLSITPPAPNTKNGIVYANRSRIHEDKYLIRQKLTKREQEVLKLISQAKNNKEIADELYISDKTAGVHRKNIMRKLGVRNTLNLIRYVVDNQLI